jgi:hypothetical protein
MVVTLFALTGCYEKYDTPIEWSRADDTSAVPEGYELVPISTVTALFADPAHTLTDKNGATTLGQSPKQQATYGKYYLISEKYVIKGKVISNDAYGNYYRSLHILDESASGDDRQGIEVKIGTSGLNTKYPVGETVYVICDGLALGNYRSMLSLGLVPTAEDESDSGEPYANKYMDIQSVIDRHVKLGAKTILTLADTIVIKSTETYTEAQFEKLTGKLVRIEGMVSAWGPSPADDRNNYPQIMYKYGFNQYSFPGFEELMQVWKAYRDGGSVGEPPHDTDTRFPNMVWPEPKNIYINYSEKPLNIHTVVQQATQPSWGFQENKRVDNMQAGSSESFEEYKKRADQSNYVSARFDLSNYSGKGEVLIRTSGYARFAMEPITPDGESVDVTGIMARYTDKSATARTLAWQIAVNNVTDIVE